MITCLFFYRNPKFRERSDLNSNSDVHSPSFTATTNTQESPIDVVLLITEDTQANLSMPRKKEQHLICDI